MSDKIKTGNKGEDLAANFLTEKGYEIVARNYRYKHAEIDIIARLKNFLVFVEVKTRSSSAFGEPENFVNKHKAGKIMEGAEQFMIDNAYHGNIRFDIISIKLSTTPSLEHFEDAFH
jgi:putative endonuclease